MFKREINEFNRPGGCRQFMQLSFNYTFECVVYKNVDTFVKEEYTPVSLTRPDAAIIQHFTSADLFTGRLDLPPPLSGVRMVPI